MDTQSKAQAKRRRSETRAHEEAVGGQGRPPRDADQRAIPKKRCGEESGRQHSGSKME